MATIGAVIYVSLSWINISHLGFGSRFDTYLYLLAGLIVGRQAFAVSRSALMGLGLERTSEPLMIFQKVSFGIFALTLVYFGYGVAGALLGHILASVAVSILAMKELFNRFDSSIILRRIPENFPKRELLSFNLLSVVLILLTASLYHVDILLLRPITGSQSTGYYRAALMVAEFLWFVPNVIQTIFLYSTSELWSENQTKQISVLVSKATRYNLLLTSLLAIGIAVLADSFLPLYFGTEFEAATTPLLLLLPGTFGFALARPIFAVGQGKGALKPLIIATGAAALLNLLLNLILIPVYGMSGAAVATSVSYGSMVIFHIIVARRLGYDPIEDLKLARISLVALLSALVVLLLDKI